LSPIEYPADFAGRVLDFADTCLRDRTPKTHVLITPPPPPRVPDRAAAGRAPGAESAETVKTAPDRAGEPVGDTARAFDAASLRRGDGGGDSGP
jgi:hypothetical protein